jgi:hypothetical protein
LVFTTVKHKSIYLYLALACFLGIIIIFIFDGYLGLYDSLSVKSINLTQKVDTELWQQGDRFGYVPSVSVDSGGDIPFTYEVDNRRFYSYEATVAISLWNNQSKIMDIKSETLTLGAFGKGQVDWALNFDDYIPDNLPAGSTYDFTILINRGDVERRVIVYISPVIPLPKPPLATRAG